MKAAASIMRPCGADVNPCPAAIDLLLLARAATGGVRGGGLFAACLPQPIRRAKPKVDVGIMGSTGLTES